MVAEFPLSPNLEFAILASDGIWEVMGSQEAVDMASKALSSTPGAANVAAHAAVRRLTVEASKRWYSHEHLVDDITVILLVFDRAKAGGAVEQAV